MSELNPFISATPESQGVSSRVVTAFINKLIDLKGNFHSVIIVRNGRVLSEGYFAPINKDTLGPVFSITKSFVSIAIGLMADEGKLSLDDPVAEYFPEFVNENTHPLILKTTIRDMLKMTDCHEEDTFWIESRQYLFEKDWAKSWFETEPTHVPGKIFRYNSTCSYMLGVIVEKLAGIPFLDYMRKRVLNDIGFSSKAYCGVSPDGFSKGASGLICTARDVVRLASLCLDKGIYNGRQLISREYIEEATSYQSGNQLTSLINDSEHHYGYGYQIWKTNHDGFAFVGVLGKLAVCIPDQKLIVAVTGDIRDEGAVLPGVYRAIWDILFPELHNNPLKENEEDLKNLRNLESSLKLVPVSGSSNSPIADTVSGLWYSFPDNATGLQKVCVEFNGDNGVLLCRGTMGECRLEFGLGYVKTANLSDNLMITGSAAWVDAHTLDLEFRTAGEGFGNSSMVMYFDDSESVTVWMNNGNPPYMIPYGGFASGNSI